MRRRRRLKRFLIAGAVAGAILTIAISLFMDVLYADVLGGTWRDAIVKDLMTFFSVSVSSGSFVVTVTFLFILLVLGSFGAAAGVMFTVFVYRFLELLLKENDNP